jgi:hypothetical protein
MNNPDNSSDSTTAMQPMDGLPKSNSESFDFVSKTEIAILVLRQPSDTGCIDSA